MAETTTTALKGRGGPGRNQGAKPKCGSRVKNRIYLAVTDPVYAALNAARRPGMAVTDVCREAIDTWLAARVTLEAGNDKLALAKARTQVSDSVSRVQLMLARRRQDDLDAARAEDLDETAFAKGRAGIVRVLRCVAGGAVTVADQRRMGGKIGVTYIPSDSNLDPATLTFEDLEIQGRLPAAHRAAIRIAVAADRQALIALGVG